MTGGETRRAGSVVARLARQVEVCLAGQDLSLSQYRTLLLLADGSAAASALADRLAVSRPSVTAVVDGLVGRGLIERRSEPGDRRRVTHVLTLEGRRVLDAADAAAAARLSEIAAHVVPEEASAAFRGLARWQKALDAFRAERTTANPKTALRPKTALPPKTARPDTTVLKAKTVVNERTAVRRGAR